MNTLGQEVDGQLKYINGCLSEGQTFYPATRCILSEFPKMATRGNGKGKGKTSKACADQSEYDAYMAGGKSEVTELKDLEA